MAGPGWRLAPAGMLAVLLLAGCEPMPAATALSLRPPPPLTAEELAARLPEDAAGFHRGTTAPLPLGQGGQETGYRTAGRTAAGATVELFRPAGAPLPDAPDSPEVTAAFEALLEEALRPAPHRRVHEDKRLTLAGGLRCAETAGLYGRERVQGLVCAAGVGGLALRIRVTMPLRGPVAGEPQGFATAIATALRTPH